MAHHHFGLQKQVISLYRRFKRIINDKKFPNAIELHSLIRDEFEKHRGINHRDTFIIEYLLRRGEVQLKTFEEAENISIYIGNDKDEMKNSL